MVAFIAILVTISFLAIVAAALAFFGKYAEALGFGGLTTGLVGVLGTWKPRAPDNPTSENLQTAIEKIPPVTEHIR